MKNNISILRDSLKRIDYRLLLALILMGLLPTIYTTVRINFLGALPNDWGYNIASQLSWLNVMYEVVHEALMLPMLFLIGRFLSDQVQFNKAVSNGLILVITLYSIISIFTLSFARPLVVFMSQQSELVDATVSYIRLEAIALFLAAVVRFFTLVLLALKRNISLLIILAIQLVLSVAFDSLLLSPLPFSLNIGVNGIAITNILVNSLLTIILLFMLRKQKVNLFDSFFKFDVKWMKEWFRVGGLSGLESFVRNAAFVLMIIRLVNEVQQQGNFWVTNNFIWGWLLIPIIALGELIKRDVAENISYVKTHTMFYSLLTTVFVMFWIITIPLWRPFIQHVMGVADFAVIFRLSLISLGFYIVFAYNNIVDSIFYGSGRTDLMLYQSLLVNLIFYGGLFLFYQSGLFQPSLIGITIMFGTGITIDSIITFVMFKRFRKKLSIET